MKKIPKAVMERIDKTTFVFVGTASHRGVPHLVIEKGLELLDDQHISFKAWFCHRGIENMGESPKVAIALVDEDGEGYQLLGDIVEMKEADPSEVHEPGTNGGEDFPKAPHVLNIMVESVMPLRCGAHSDREMMV
jgi:hypothetical protein